MKPEIIKAQEDALNALYQELLARKIVIPGEIKVVFHEHMNRLTECKKKIPQ